MKLLDINFDTWYKYAGSHPGVFKFKKSTTTGWLRGQVDIREERHSSGYMAATIISIVGGESCIEVRKVGGESCIEVRKVGDQLQTRDKIVLADIEKIKRSSLRSIAGYQSEIAIAEKRIKQHEQILRIVSV